MPLTWVIFFNLVLWLSSEDVPCESKIVQYVSITYYPFIDWVADWVAVMKVKTMKLDSEGNLSLSMKMSMPENYLLQDWERVTQNIQV